MSGYKIIQHSCFTLQAEEHLFWCTGLFNVACKRVLTSKVADTSDVLKGKKLPVLVM